MKFFLYFSVLLTIAFSVASYSQSRPVKIINISNSPIDSFKDHCSRCHGYEGSSYGSGFGEMGDNELKKVVKEMMIGPAQLKPDDVEIEAMYSYNKSLRDNKPFAIALNSKSFLEGESKSLLINVSPKAILQIESDSQIKIKKDGSIYNLFYNPGKIEKLKITVTRDKISSSFYFPERLWCE